MNSKQHHYLRFDLKKLIPAIIILVAGITFNSCKYDVENADPCSSVIPDSVSFSNNILPIFKANCSMSGCHAGGSPGGNLNLEDSLAYNALWKPGSGYIKIDYPTHSILYSQLLATNKPMPPSGKLNQCDINMILKWIQQSAKNN